MYKIKTKWIKFMFKYAKTTLDLNGTYIKEEWNKAGFKDSIIEKV